MMGLTIDLTFDPSRAAGGEDLRPLTIDLSFDLTIDWTINLTVDLTADLTVDLTVVRPCPSRSGASGGGWRGISESTFVSAKCSRRPPSRTG